MNCDHFSYDSELYVLGVLESDEATAFAEHLAGGCVRCQAELRRAAAQAEILSRAIPIVDPPARLRRRIKASLIPDIPSRFQFFTKIFAAVAVVALVITLAWINRDWQTRSEASARLSPALAILSAPGTKQVPFAEARADAPRGTLYIHSQLGMVLVVNNLPPAPAGSKYQSWVVPKSGSPQPVQSFAPDSSGHAVSVFSGPVDATAMAVSIEPRESAPKKPTRVIFAAHS